MPQPPVSDVDRSRALSEVSEAFQAGRVTADEFDPAIAGDRIVVAAVTGDQFDTGLLRSADLLLVPGTVTADIAEPAVRRSEATHPEDWDADDLEEVPAA